MIHGRFRLVSVRFNRFGLRPIRLNSADTTWFWSNQHKLKSSRHESDEKKKRSNAAPTREQPRRATSDSGAAPSQPCSCFIVNQWVVLMAVVMSGADKWIGGRWINRWRSSLWKGNFDIEKAQCWESRERWLSDFCKIFYSCFKCKIFYSWFAWFSTLTGKYFTVYLILHQSRHSKMCKIFSWKYFTLK